MTTNDDQYDPEGGFPLADHEHPDPLTGRPLAGSHRHGPHGEMHVHRPIDPEELKRS